MSNSFEYVEINLSIDKNKLYRLENCMLNINIINKSNFKIENSLFGLNIDKNIFSILDEKYNVCINEFGSIGNINPNSSINISIPMQVASMPKELTSKIFGYMNFHIIDNGNLVDLNCNSNHLNVDFIEINKIDESNFKISSSKDRYLLDDDIDITVSIKNNGNGPLNNVRISNYIPENTYIVEDSIAISSYENMIVAGENIILTKLKKDEEIFLTYKISVNQKINSSLVKINPKLSYVIEDVKKIDVFTTPLEIEIVDNYIFNEDTIRYTIDKNKGFKDEVITHNISISNKTNINISSLDLKMKSNCNIDFITNSLIVNDIYRVGENINDSIYLGELDSYEEIIITFKTKVLFEEKDTNLYFDLKYDTPKRNLTQQTNSVNYKLIDAVFNESCFIKKQSRENYKLGEIIDFSIDITNLGNIDASNVMLVDKLLPTLELIPNSIYINSIQGRNIENTNLIFLGTLKPNEKVSITYKAKAIDICTDKKSSAYINYSIENKYKNLKAISNYIDINIIGAKIGNNSIKKELSSYTAQIGDIITTRLIIENTGNIDCECLKIIEQTNNALEFIEGSLIINNNVNRAEDIFNGINIDKIKPNENIIITYQLKVLDFPKPNPITDKVSLTYSHVFNDKIISNIVYSNKSKLYVNNPNLSVLDKNSSYSENAYSKFCNYGDYIFYNLVLENKGNVGLENISLDFHLPEDLTLDKSSVKINNCIYNKKFDNLIQIPNLNVSQKIFIEFYVKHSFKNDYNVESFLNFEYTFRDLQNKIPFRKSKKFKEKIIVIKPNIEIEKFISDKFLEIDKEFTKNINIKNTGNVILENIKVKLNENNILKKSDSTLFLNGNHLVKNDILEIDKLDVNETVNIAIRYNLSDIDCYEIIVAESEVSATYKSNNDKTISIKSKSNILKLNIKNYHTSINGKSSLDTLMLDTKSTYIFTIINDGNIDCYNYKLNINLGECIEYVQNSICINGRKINIKNIYLPIDIGTLKCNESIVISFDFIAINIPYKNTTSIRATLESLYSIGRSLVNKTFESNDEPLNIENLSVDIIKSPSHDYLQSGDILRIQTVINNTGTIDINNLVFKDNEEKNLNFVADSVYINGQNITDINPLDGIILGDLNSSDNILISCEYEYVPMVCCNKVTHFSTIDYLYSIKSIEDKMMSLQSEPIYIEGALSTFKQFNMENEYILKEYEPDICDVVKVFSEAQIDTFYEIDTIKNKSYDNSSATGKKVIIKGSVLDRVEYLIKNEKSSLYMLERNHPFTIFINLPIDYKNEDLYFRGRCEDVFYKTTSSRGIFVSSLISIEGLL